MMILKEELGVLFTQALTRAYPGQETTIKLEYPTEAANGEYATPVALEVGKKVGEPPRMVAQKIVDEFVTPPWVEKIQIAGPGFINIFISSDFLTNSTHEITLTGEKFGTSTLQKNKTVVTDTSHPNVAKPMGVHHLLSTIIGNTLNRLFAAVGYTVVRDNYLGDWGTQFGKLIYAYRTWGDEAVVKADPIPELLKLYVHFHNEAEKNPAVEDHGRAEFKKLEDGDEENLKLWKWIVELSVREFEKTWKRLDVNFDYIHGESFYEDKMAAIIEMGVAKGLFVEGEKGALIAPFSHEKYPPCIIRKSDGATLYATRDLARIKYWEDTWHPDLMINVVDVAQTLHFLQINEVAEKMKLTDAENLHISFGRMSFPEKRMSTRKGNIVSLEELLDEAEEGAYQIVSEKNPELSEEKKRRVAKQVGIGAIKYVILGQNRISDVVFTWEKMLSMEGLSGPYIQYVHARACSILRKYSEVKKSSTQSTVKKYTFKEPQELALARLLVRLPEVVQHAAREYKPNLLCTYLFEVAAAFNSFYASVHVLGEESHIEAQRVALVEATAVVLKNGLGFLGIAAPEEM